MTMDWINEAAQVGKELKEQIREAHGLLRDLKILQREMTHYRREAEHVIPLVVKTAFEESIGDTMREHQQKMEDLAVESVQEISRNVLATVKETMDIVDKETSETIQKFSDAVEMLDIRKK